jgi:acyl-coenzyme A thioesterase PaaI-like protein
LIARARVLRAGRTITVCQADGFMRSGDAEHLVATMVGTMIRGRAPESAAGSS